MRATTPDEVLAPPARRAPRWRWVLRVALALEGLALGVYGASALLPDGIASEGKAPSAKVAAPSAVLRARTEPPGATLTLGNHLVCEATPCALVLKPRTRKPYGSLETLRFELPSGHLHVLSRVVRPGDTIEVHARLGRPRRPPPRPARPAPPPPPREALVEVFSDPPGATVSRDGEVVCSVTPCVLSVEIQPGEAPLEIDLAFERRGYRSTTVSRVILPDRRSWIHARLRPAPGGSSRGPGSGGEVPDVRPR